MKSTTDLRAARRFARSYFEDRHIRTAAAARKWIRAWSDGWRDHQPEVIASRYADDCVLLSQPFREPGRGRAAVAAYARQAFADEQAADFTFNEPVVGEDGRAAVEYRAVVTAPDGSKTTLAGTSMLRFNDDGLVVEHRDYWATTETDLGLEPPWRTTS